ncbi:hypothetical protein KCP75_02515 [Salmonella enterica subsp. enterica]|nr:hypothetical protein KCP75_02515 [Salmonella enterica subsp. enterica]
MTPLTIIQTFQMLAVHDGENVYSASSSSSISCQRLGWRERARYCVRQLVIKISAGRRARAASVKFANLPRTEVTFGGRMVSPSQRRSSRPIRRRVHHQPCARVLRFSQHRRRGFSDACARRRRKFSTSPVRRGVR